MVTWSSARHCGGQLWRGRARRLFGMRVRRLGPDLAGCGRSLGGACWRGAHRGGTPKVWPAVTVCATTPPRLRPLQTMSLDGALSLPSGSPMMTFGANPPNCKVGGQSTVVRWARAHICISCLDSHLLAVRRPVGLVALGRTSTWVGRRQDCDGQPKMSGGCPRQVAAMQVQACRVHRVPP